MVCVCVCELLTTDQINGLILEGVNNSKSQVLGGTTEEPKVLVQRSPAEPPETAVGSKGSVKTEITGQSME